MTRRTFGSWLALRAPNWADLAVFLSLVGLLATLGWLGHDLWAPFTSTARPAMDLSPWNLPYYAARSLLRMS